VLSDPLFHHITSPLLTTESVITLILVTLGHPFIARRPIFIVDALKLTSGVDGRVILDQPRRPRRGALVGRVRLGQRDPAPGTVLAGLFQQRRLRIGFTRAARRVEAMEEKGIVGPPETGTSTRQVLDYDPAAPPSGEA
jgi:hypothetical protein